MHTFVPTTLTGKELDHARDIIAQVSKLGAGLASKGLDLNTEIALETADNAVTNNFLAHPFPEYLRTDAEEAEPGILGEAEERARLKTGLSGEEWENLSRSERLYRIIAEAHDDIEKLPPQVREVARKSLDGLWMGLRMTAYYEAGLAGATAGAAMGSIVPGVGTVGGGLVGGAAGIGALYYTEHKIGEGMEYLVNRVGDDAVSFGRSEEDAQRLRNNVTSMTGKGLESLGILPGVKYLHGAGTRLLNQHHTGFGGQSVVKMWEGSKNSLEKINLTYDYSTPHAPYSLRICPKENRGPMHVNSQEFTHATSYTAEGAQRNMPQFWKLWAEKYPETLSADNLELIRERFAPKVDEQWLSHFPEHQQYKDKILIHHHIEHGHLTTALPQDLHRKNPGNAMFHTNLGGKNNR